MRFKQRHHLRSQVVGGASGAVAGRVAASNEAEICALCTKRGESRTGGAFSGPQDGSSTDKGVFSVTALPGAAAGSLHLGSNDGTCCVSTS